MTPAEFPNASTLPNSDPQLPNYPIILSIVIVNWNTCEFLLGALRSIFDTPTDFSVEVIVVDNASTDGSAAATSSEFPEVVLIANKENNGYARGNNQGIEAS